MMKATKCQLPADCLLNQFLPADYTDSFSITTSGKIGATPDDIMVRFWTDMPGWINALFKLRNTLVRVVGLQGSEKNNHDEIENCIRNGGTYRFVEVPIKSGQETVMVMRDKHLDAYLSVQIDNNTAYINTLVKFNNALGKVYFFVIRPFHGIVVMAMLKRAVRGSV